jgi:hypothetical protein
VLNESSHETRGDSESPGLVKQDQREHGRGKGKRRRLKK